MPEEDDDARNDFNEVFRDDDDRFENDEASDDMNDPAFHGMLGEETGADDRDQSEDERLERDQVGGAGDDALLKVSGLSVSFGRQQILRDIHLDIATGETVVIIGESGCGKTVLLKTLIGLVRPTAGRVVFDRNDLADLSAAKLAKLRTRYGFVFQQAALFDSMTVGQNVAFPLREHNGRTRREIRDIVRRRIHEVGLPESVVSKKPAQLSGGQRKRVGIARALVMDPDLLLYDEPTTGLDSHHERCHQRADPRRPSQS